MKEEPETIEKMFPTPPLTEKDFIVLEKELEEMKAKLPKGCNIFDYWIAKNGGGTLYTKMTYRLAVRPHEYKILSDKWSKYMFWKRGKERGSQQRLSQLEENNGDII